MTPVWEPERIALISDVHGNLTALEAVLADIDARGIGRIFNLGDYVGKGHRGREVIETCRERCEVNILGNWDDFLPHPAREFDNASLQWWLAQLGPGQGEWLRGLPFCHDFQISGRQVRLMHASAETVHRRVRYVHDEAEFLGQFANTPATGNGPVPDVVGYADTHDPFYETQLRGRTLFNTGSVGNCMGDPTPLYCIIEGVMDSPDPAPFALSFVRVPYDLEAELAHARQVDAPEYDGYESEPVLAGVPVRVLHTDVAMHVPVEVAERARAAAAEHVVDAIVCVGGGSTTGLAKAVALTTGLPILAVPTTYAGSEATDVWGLTEHGRKTTGSDPRVLPRSIVYDASLMLALPVTTSVASGFNALAHCVDAMWAPRTDPVDQALAAEGMRALRTGLPRVVEEPLHLEGREQTLYGAYLAAVAFASAGSGLHHKICHVLGGMFGLPHAETHAVVLPYVVALNAPAVPELDHRMAAALQGATTLAGLGALREETGAPTSLRDLGLHEDELPTAVQPILEAVPPSNPVPVTAEGVEALLHAAWAGKEPS